MQNKNIVYHKRKKIHHHNSWHETNFASKTKIKDMTKITRTDKNGISCFTLVNANGNSVELSSLGAGITSIVVPDCQGRKTDVVLGYTHPLDYMDDSACAGKTPGRFANRIAKGRFSIDGQTYHLAINNYPNALHGGPKGFHNVVWNAEITNTSNNANDSNKDDQNMVLFTYDAADGEEGYPGNMHVEVAYAWSDNDELTITYKATTDRPTIVNLTNHAYFNLSGEDSGSCLGHCLKLDSHQWLPADNTDIPLGTIAPVAGTPMDFTSLKPLGRDINKDFYNLKPGKGYNHFFLIDGWKGDGQPLHAATLTDSRSGRRLDISTTQCGIMLYTGNWLADNRPESKSGRHYGDHDGVALECQGAPDAPNQPQLPSQRLNPGETYRQTIKYSFSTETKS